MNADGYDRKNMTIVANVPPRWTTHLPAGEDYLINHRALGSLVTDVFDVADAQQAFTAAFLEDVPARGKVLIRADSWESAPMDTLDIPED